MEPERLSEATLLARTGVSRRSLTRYRQQGLILPSEPRRGLGRGPGSSGLQYSHTALSTAKRLEELKPEFKKVFERRWRLWLEEHPVRIAVDLADTLKSISRRMSKIKTFAELEGKIYANLPMVTELPRGNPLRTIYHGLSRRDAHSLTTMCFCILLGIRLPLFDEPDPHPFKIYKRLFGLPNDWKMPAALFDIFPILHEQITNALGKASPEDLRVARAICQFLSRLIDAPGDWKSGTTVWGAPVPSRLIEFAGVLWQSPETRAVIVGVIVLVLQGYWSAVGEDGFATLVSRLSEMYASPPGSA